MFHTLVSAAAFRDFCRLRADDEETTFGQGDAEKTLLAYGDVQQNYFILLGNKKHTICYTLVALHTVVCACLVELGDF